MNRRICTKWVAGLAAVMFSMSLAAQDPVKSALTMGVGDMHDFFPMLGIVFVLIVVVGLGACLLPMFKRQNKERYLDVCDVAPYEIEPPHLTTAETAKYEAEPSLLTPTERSFFGVLHQALGPEYYICPKVRLADIIRPAKQSSRSGWQTAFNRISGKHVDFVICNPADLGVLGVVELDDRTHQRFERGSRDGAVDAALAGAGIQVIRVQAREYYSQPAVRDLVRNSLKRAAAASDSASSQKLFGVGMQARRQPKLNFANQGRSSPGRPFAL